MHPLIYLDNNATTPVDERVIDAVVPFFREHYANASSTHFFGESVNRAVKKARSQVATLIGAFDKEIVFTSGATEAINMAIKGAAEYNAAKGNHIITVATEHKAVLDTCAYLATKGYEITYLPVDEEGLVNIECLKREIRATTILISVMFANNETGVLQQIREIAALSRESGILFFTDATQAVGKVDIDVEELGIDLLSLSGHKMYSIKGAGALYINQSVRTTAQTHGGGHENGLRSGTLNVPAIVGLGCACKIQLSEMAADAERVKYLRNLLEELLLKIEGTSVNGSVLHRLYNTTNIYFRDIDANVVIGRLKKLAVSNGSACSAAVVEPSHVLKAMGLDNEQAFGSLRFSLGKYNTEEDVRNAALMLAQEIEILRN